MTKFEDVGRKLDRELERLRRVAESKISPATRRKAAKSLRSVSETLARVAAGLESKIEPKSE
jgi:hypothetical protein